MDKTIAQHTAQRLVNIHPSVVESYDYKWENSEIDIISTIYCKDGTIYAVLPPETEEEYLNRKDREQQEALMEHIENIEAAAREIECSHNCGDYKKRCDGPDDPGGCLYHLMAD